MGLFKRLFKKPEPLPPIDFGVVGVDMHSHLVPGIDDGSPNMEASLAMIRHFADLGYRKIITTPHVMSDYYRNTSEIITKGRDAVRSALKAANIDIAFDAAAEYYLDEHFEKLIEANDILTIGNRYVLFELPFMAAPDMLKSTLFKLQMAGYKPILAHPERYPYWHRETQKFKDLVDRDVLLQININSLTGFYGPGVQKCGEWLIDQGLVAFAASDCHHPGHLQLMQEARTLPHLHRLVESGKLLNTKLAE
ncbi:MAG: tyrosine-protein phosphatase [Flavobacteriales bacterium]